jgi:hypothetical protein
MVEKGRVHGEEKNYRYDNKIFNELFFGEKKMKTREDKRMIHLDILFQKQSFLDMYFGKKKNQHSHFFGA